MEAICAWMIQRKHLSAGDVFASESIALGFSNGSTVAPIYIVGAAEYEAMQSVCDAAFTPTYSLCSVAPTLPPPTDISGQKLR